MRPKLLFLLLLICAGAQSQQLQAVVYENWEEDAWVNWYRQDLTYDNQGYVITYLVSNWDIATASWNQSSRSVVTNNTSGNPTEWLSQDWLADSNTWQNGTRTIMTYNSFGKEESRQFEQWGDGVWVPLSRSEMTYDANQLLVSEYWQVWNFEFEQWVNSTQIAYTNDTNGNMLQSTHEQWDGSEWINSHRVLQTFSATNKLTLILNQTWNGADWADVTDIAYLYDSSDYLAYEIYRVWNSDGNVWINSHYAEYFTNGDGTISQYVSQDWLGGSEWSDFQRATFYYNTLGVTQNSSLSFDFYPNPVKDILEVSVQENTSARLTIADMNGKIVHNSPMSDKNTTVDLRQLPTGMYVLQVEQQGKTQTKKFLKD